MGTVPFFAGIVARMSWREELGVTRAEPVGGGDINEAWRAMLADGRRVFVKTHAAAPPGMFEAEARGLAWLREGPLRVPEVVAVSAELLALEWLELEPRGGVAFDEAFGRGLAGLHRLGARGFGLDADNYLATLRQDNTAEADVATFYVERRVRPLVRRIDGGARLEAALDRIPPARVGPAEAPARLHGDLWWGNVAACAGAPVVFDPAVYGGHREIDLAMLALFGGVSARLIAAYEEVWPLARGWRERVGLWQLYPLAAHAVLFGGGYVAQLARALETLG
jgi:fructosamine-3-kinase